MGQVSSRLTGLFNENAKQNDTNDEFRSRKISNFKREDQHFDINDSEIFLNGSSNDTCTLKPISSFATPRLPLKRTREISPITAELPQKILDLISPCCKKLRMDDEHLDFHFLNDSKSLDYLRKCKVMFIMRGIPGSGKSTITKHLRKMYTSLEICSADDFFVVGTDYQYDPNKIGEAHKYGKQKAVNAAVAETMTIIIDNTNIKFWEMKFYLSLAKSFNYIPIIVEPKTPWRNDVKLLAEKNTHNLDEKSIKLKIKNYEKLNPLYYGWFINEKDSYLLNVEGQSWIEEAFTSNLFMKDLSSFSGIQSFNEFLETYRVPGNSPLFHVTSKYTARQGKSPEVAAYLESVEVQNAIGKVFDLEIVCFVITPRTFGARVKLSEEQKILWGGEDEENIPSEFWNASLQGASSSTIIDFSKSENDFPALELSLNGEKAEEIQITSLIENSENLNGTTVIQCDKKCDESDVYIVSEIDSDRPIVSSSHENINPKINDEIIDGTLTDLNNHNTFPNKFDTEHPLNNEFEQDIILDANNDVNSSVTVSENSIETKKKVSEETVLPKNKVNPIEVQAYQVNVELATPPTENIEVRLFCPNKNESKKYKSPNKNRSPNKSESNKSKSPNKNKSPKKEDVLIPENNIKPACSKVGSTIKEVDKCSEIKLPPTSGRGRRAHVTLGCKSDVKPVTTGLDLLFAVELEAQELSKLNTGLDVVGAQDALSCPQSVSDNLIPDKAFKHTLLLNGAKATNYGNGVWVIYLEKALVISSIFNFQC